MRLEILNLLYHNIVNPWINRLHSQKILLNYVLSNTFTPFQPSDTLWKVLCSARNRKYWVVTFPRFYLHFWRRYVLISEALPGTSYIYNFRLAITRCCNPSWYLYLDIHPWQVMCTYPSILYKSDSQSRLCLKFLR